VVSRLTGVPRSLVLYEKRLKEGRVDARADIASRHGPDVIRSVSHSFKIVGWKTITRNRESLLIIADAANTVDLVLVRVV
jgi:hypothetical protein